MAASSSPSRGGGTSCEHSIPEAEAQRLVIFQSQEIPTPLLVPTDAGAATSDSATALLLLTVMVLRVAPLLLRKAMHTSRSHLTRHPGSSMLKASTGSCLGRCTASRTSAYVAFAQLLSLFTDALPKLGAQQSAIQLPYLRLSWTFRLLSFTVVKRLKGAAAVGVNYVSG
ncbi:hypothetical protein AURDEDRAFT_124901 [Auricularia subglabra TFB-10046 SS5]|nr:hypothetical protein AURDEDRAFT_124901 [Auricularia subglabra TFB-10046 SS5]